MKWANRSLDLITIGNAIFQLVRTKVADLLLTWSDDNIWWKFLIGLYSQDEESMIPKYSEYPHRCSDWQPHILLKTDSFTLRSCADAKPT